MAADAPATVTEADVRTLAARLKGFHALLTPPEQALLHAVLQRAAGCASELPSVGGAAWAVRFNPFPCLDAVAAAEFGTGPDRPPTEDRSDD